MELPPLHLTKPPLGGRTGGNVLFVGVSAEPFGPNPAAIVLSASIQSDARLRESTHCSYLDFIVGTDSLESMLWAILARRPDVVAFSVYSWNASTVESLVEAIFVANPSISTIAGGAGLRQLKEDVLSRLAFWTTGHGDVALPDWLADSSSHATLDEVIRTARPYTDRQDEYVSAFPDKRVICYDASRGCPFKCSFCIEGDRTRSEIRRPTSVIAAELQQLASYGYELIDIADNTANHDPSVFDMYVAFAQRNPKTVIHLEARPEFFRSSQCEFVRDAPNVQLYMGLQSASSAETEAVHRRNCLSKFERLMNDWLDPAKRKCIVGIDLIYGLPKQTFSSFLQSFDYVASLLPNKVCLNHYQAYGYAHNSRDDADTEAILPIEYLSKIARTKTLSVDDTVEFWKFKKVFQALQHLGHWSAAINVAVTTRGMAASEFYCDLGRRVDLPLARDDLIRMALDELQRRLPASAYRHLESHVCNWRDCPQSIPLFQHGCSNVLQVALKMCDTRKLRTNTMIDDARALV